LPLAQQLEAERNRLQALLQRYKPDHPDVRSAERSIAQLQQKIEDEAQRPATDKPQPKLLTREEQDREKRARDFEAELEVIDHQLEVNQAEETRIRAVIAEYQRKVEAVPTRESELVELTRDYDVLKKSYDSLLMRQQDSKLAANLERRQIGEQFRVLDAASLPERPVNNSTRLGIIFAGAIAGLVLGLACALLLELRNSSFGCDDEIARLLSLPVLASVPLMATERERSRRHLRRLAGDMAGACVLVASVAIVAVWGLR
jgi:uncharacterized protein involved in exopolysaccharide biosynthesis